MKKSKTLLIILVAGTALIGSCPVDIDRYNLSGFRFGWSVAYAASGTSVYDFDGCALGSNCWAYEKGDTQPLSPASYDNEASSGDYVNLGSSNNSRWITASANVSDEYDSQIYTFTINETISDITQINIDWEGYGETQAGYLTYLKIWNNSTNSWEQLSGGDFTSTNQVS